MNGRREEKTVAVFRAGDIGAAMDVPELTIIATRAIDGTKSLGEVRGIFAEDGRKLADAIVASLPGGTVDVLLAELLRRRASMLVIPFREV